MARKVTYEQALVAHGWVAFDPADTGVIEKLFKKDIRQGLLVWKEARLKLSSVECHHAGPKVASTSVTQPSVRFSKTG